MNKLLNWTKTGGLTLVGLGILIAFLWIFNAIIPKLIIFYEKYLYTPIAVIEFVAFYLSILLLLIGLSRFRSRIILPLLYSYYVLAVTLVLHSFVNTYNIWGLMGTLVGIALFGIGTYFTGLAALFVAHQWFALATFILDGLFILFIRYTVQRWLIKENTPEVPEVEESWGDKMIKSPKFGRALADHLYKIGQIKEKITDEDLEEIYHKKKEEW